MTDLERVIKFLWLTGTHLAQSSLVKEGEIILCKNGKILRYAPYDIDIDWEKDLTSFTVVGEDYDLIVMNDCDYKRALEED